MGLTRHTVASVRPGTARNHLVPSKQAVYAHYLNRQRLSGELEGAAALRDAISEGTVEATESEALEEARQARVLARLRAIRVEATLPADARSRLLVTYSASDICKAVLAAANIVLPPELVMLPNGLRDPGTFRVPLAVTDGAGSQVSLSVRLTPRQASAEELRELGGGEDGADRGGADGLGSDAVA